MTAKEMFEELGYIFDGTKDWKITYRGINCLDEIIIYKQTKTFQKKSFGKNESILNFKELQAINKQVEELGWK